MHRLLAVAAVLIGVTLLLADQDPTQKQKAIGDNDFSAAWVYDDLPAAFAQAKKEGKPLFVVFR